jgi:presenilin-like A22 family membrane protease
MTGLIVNIVHALVIGPVLIYIGLVKPTQTWIYYILLAVGILIAVKFVYSLIKQKNDWYIIHLALFAPLLIYVGIRKNDTPNIGFALMLALGCAASGYHIIRLMQKAAS